MQPAEAVAEGAAAVDPCIMLTSRWVRHGDNFLQPVQTGDCSTIYGRMWRSIVDLRSWGRRGRRKVLLCRSRCMRGSCGPTRSVSCSRRGVGGVEHRTGAGWRVTVPSSGQRSAVRVSGLEGSRTRNGQWTHRGARARRRVPGVEVYKYRMSHDEYTRRTVYAVLPAGRSTGHR